MNKEFIEKVKSEFPECVEFNGGVLFWNGFAPIFIGYHKGYFAAIIAIDTDDDIAKEFVMSGCYSYTQTPHETFDKKKNIKTHWWRRSTYFTSLNECVIRYKADEKKIEEAKMAH